MTAAAEETLHELLTQSLIAWRVTGCVNRTGDGAMMVCANAADIRIEPASADLPFRWVVSIDGRRRPAVSLVAVLRQLRAALDPGYATNRLRIAVSPLVPQ